VRTREPTEHEITRRRGAELAVIAFVWYMFWGYKTNGQAKGDRGV
jgi:hypothetical protein